MSRKEDYDELFAWNKFPRFQIFDPRIVCRIGSKLSSTWRPSFITETLSGKLEEIFRIADLGPD